MSHELVIVLEFVKERCVIWNLEYHRTFIDSGFVLLCEAIWCRVRDEGVWWDWYWFWFVIDVEIGSTSTNDVHKRLRFSAMCGIGMGLFVYM